jgi:hypothetical protein
VPGAQLQVDEKCSQLRVKAKERSEGGPLDMRRSLVVLWCGRGDARSARGMDAQTTDDWPTIELLRLGSLDRITAVYRARLDRTAVRAMKAPRPG